MSRVQCLAKTRRKKAPSPLPLSRFVTLRIRVQWRETSFLCFYKGYDKTSVTSHLFAPYTHETPTSSKKQMNRSGSVPVKLSNICSQYSPDLWQNSKPTTMHRKQVSPGGEIKTFHLSLRNWGNYFRKLLHSDWLRAGQFIVNFKFAWECKLTYGL